MMGPTEGVGPNWGAAAHTQIHPPHAKLERGKHLPRGLGRGGDTTKEGLYPTQCTQKRGSGGGGLHACGLLLVRGKGSEGGRHCGEGGKGGVEYELEVA